MKYLWDYNLKKNWRPLTETEWIWYLERKLNYQDWEGLRKAEIAKFFTRLKLDPAVKLLLEAYFKYHGKT